MPLLNVLAARRSLVTALAVTVLSGTAAACGGGSSAASKATTTTAPTTSSTVVSRAAFRQCMASHGITIQTRPTTTTSPNGTATTAPGTPGAGFGGGGGGGGNNRFLTPPPGVDPTKYQTALTACRSLLPTGGGAGGAGGAAFRTAFVAYVTCLRNHGVTTGDPTLAQQALAGVDRTSATFVAATKACQPLLPQRPGASSTTTSAPGA